MKKILFITLLFLFTSCSKNESNWNYLFDGKNVKGLRMAIKWKHSLGTHGKLKMEVLDTSWEKWSGYHFK